MYLTFPKNPGMILNQNGDYAYALANLVMSMSQLQVIGDNCPCIDLFAFKGCHDVVFPAGVPNNIH